jgi:prepilin-type N-terminal cleavage/methylation domain-containing protein
MNQQNQRGFTFPELLTVVAIIGIMAAISTSILMNALMRTGLRSAACRVRNILVMTRANAVALEANQAVKFTQRNGAWYYAIYNDSNGNGVLNDEISSGIDPIVEGPYPLFNAGSIGQVGFPTQGVADPDTGAPIDAGASAVNFNRSTLCSFSAVGSGTPGSIYLTNGSDAMMIRSSGDSGHIRVMTYDSLWRRWEEQ